MLFNTSVSIHSNAIVTFKWKIANFSTFDNFSENSEDFFASSSNAFYLKCASNASLEDLGLYLMIYLKRSHPFERDVQVHCRLAILDRSQEKCFPKEFSLTFCASDRRLPLDGAVYILDRAYILNPANRLLHNDTLIVYCEVEVLGDDQNNKANYKEEICRNEREAITNNMSALLESSQFSDVCFVIGKEDEMKKEFQLHKAILATRSPVFSAMFSSDFVEKRQNRVEITDIRVPVFAEMIRYIYTGKTSTEGLELYAEELFMAADKYQLDSLKIEAAHELASSKLSIESVSGVLLLADMHSDAKLKRHCILYITKHVKEVVKTEAWKMAIQPRIDLTVQLYREIENWK